MSVLVKDMDMPTGCLDCPIGDALGCPFIPGIPARWKEYDIAVRTNKRHSQCPLGPATDAIEELSKLVDAIPHVCECCVGCELEKKNGGCDHAFVLSPKRAMQYLIPKPSKEKT